MANRNSKIKKALWVYWLLLVYIVAALVWWYISLEKQNLTITKQSIGLVSNEVASNKKSQIENYQILQKRNTQKHLSEGITFLVIILIGAVYVYRLVKKQLDANKQQNNFIMAVTHELKTPIAITQLNIETLQKRKIDEPTQEKLLRNSIVELQRLNDLTSNILIVSQIEHQGYQLKKEAVLISDLLKETIAEINLRFNNRVEFIDKSDRIYTQVDIFLIKLVFTNLIDNALKYSNEKVVVEINDIDNKIKITVKDLGAGIADVEKKKIFNKFYRQENELTRKQKGTGLGLYICKKIIDDHSGTLSVYNNTPHGAIFEVILKS